MFRPRTILLTTAAATLVAVPAHAAVFSGFTSAGDPIVLKTSTTGKKITRAATAISLSCPDSTKYFIPDAITGFAVSKLGSFGSEFKEDPDTFNGMQRVWSGSVAGKIKKKRSITGTWTATWDLTATDMTKQTCDSGNVKFSASSYRDKKHPLGGNYGGFSSQNFAMTFQLAPDASKVVHMAAVLDLDCGDGTGQWVSDSWTKVPVRGRAFTASILADKSTDSDGRVTETDSTVTGKVDKTGHKVTAKWTVTKRITKADGSIQTCTVPSATVTATR